ncbi:MAG: dephospho-CoA kinase, partial [Clostridia bacterium]|nr:dephospho-CoA kinase [Clostridia bacterium]
MSSNKGGNMRVIGLTGGIGTGKSTVSKYLASRGFEIIDADLIARQIVQPGSPLLDEIGVRSNFWDFSTSVFYNVAL